MKTLWLWLRSFIKPQFQFNLRPEHRVVKAFMLDGIQYYRFDKALDIPYDRAVWAHAFYMEFDARLNREYLLDWLDAMDLSINGNKRVRIGDIAILLKDLKERTQLLIDPDLALKIASVEFFDANEDPYSYDAEYNGKKIESWKKKGQLSSLFAGTPIGELISSLGQSEPDIRASLTIIEKVKGLHLQNLSAIKSRNTSTSASPSV